MHHFDHTNDIFNPDFEAHYPRFVFSRQPLADLLLAPGRHRSRSVPPALNRDKFTLADQELAMTMAMARKLSCNVMLW